MSEKDKEPLMKQTPLEGAPQFDVPAPAFVPKEEVKDLEVPEVSSLSATEMKEMGEEAKEPVISETVELPKVGETTVEEDAVVPAAPQPTPLFQPAPEAPQSVVVEPVGPQTATSPSMQIPQAPFPPVGKPMDTADKKAIRLLLGF